jgi:hypothetical protein
LEVLGFTPTLGQSGVATIRLEELQNNMQLNQQKGGENGNVLHHKVCPSSQM